VKINEHVLAQMCSLAYQEPEKLGHSLFAQWERMRAFQFSGTDAIAVATRSTAVVVVRGTQRNVIDILMDLQFTFPVKDANGGNVHRGFRRGADRLAKAGMWDWLRSLELETIWFCGHSLGGAVASVLASDAVTIPELPWATVNLFTIGQPRTGTAKWATQFTEAIQANGGQIERFVHPLDPIPRLPPTGYKFLPDYRHHGETRIVTPEGEVYPDATIPEQLALFLKMVFLSPVRSLKSHYVAQYVESLGIWTSLRHLRDLPTLIDHNAEERP
jgi:triacylglycerol lipase